MTEIQMALRDLKNNNTTSYTIECFKTKDANNGYYGLWLTNGKTSYITYENFLKLEPYIRYKEKIVKSPMEKFLESMNYAFGEYAKETGVKIEFTWSV